MPQYSIANRTIYQTEADLNENNPGAGRVTLETNVGPLRKALGCRRNYVLSGFGMPANDVNISPNVLLAGGTALIDGYLVTVGAGGSTVGLTANNSNHVWLALNFTASKVVSAFFEVNTTGSAPASSVYLGWIKTDATKVASTFSSNTEGFHAWGVIEFDNPLPHKIHGSSGNWYTDAGATPVVSVSIKFPQPLLKVPRMMLAWRYPGAQWPSTAVAPILQQMKGQSTTEIIIADTFADGEWLNFEVRA